MLPIWGRVLGWAPRKLDERRVLVDQRGVTRIALMPRAHGCWPIYFLDARRCVLLNPELVAWIEEELASLAAAK